MSIGQVRSSFEEGVRVAFTVSFGANAWNAVCVVAGQNGISTVRAIDQIYRGTVATGSPLVPHFVSQHPSLWNFGNGWFPYMGRELPRCFYKPWGAYYLIPYLQELYDVEHHPEAHEKVKLTFAAALATAEGAVAPLSWMTARLQAGKAPFPTMEEAQGANRFGIMFQSSGAQMARQFLIWYTWMSTEQQSIDLTRYMGVDPTTIPGITVQSLMQAVPVTLASYLPERLKNHIQVNPIRDQNVYYTAFKQIVESQGIRGLGRGLMPKVIATTFLAGGFNYLCNERKKRLV
ncbi:MAG: hypothetical protein V4492_06705 [Chlamydiota bacterium]